MGLSYCESYEIIPIDENHGNQTSFQVNTTTYPELLQILPEGNKNITEVSINLHNKQNLGIYYKIPLEEISDSSYQGYYNFTTPGKYFSSIQIQTVDGEFEIINTDIELGFEGEIEQTVLDNVPIADFNVNATSIYEGEWIQFTDGSHHGDLPYTYEWDFGDGSANSTQQNPIHQFDTPGTFWVTLTICDVNGKFNSTAIQINVLEHINDQLSSIDGYNGLITASVISFIGVLWVSSRKRRIIGH